jgi:RNA polymerase sigma-70 factor, ECF subfamily
VIRRCLAEIESDFREVLILRDIEGLSYEEIGQILSLAEGTVKSRLFRARAQLKALVEQAFGEKIA